MYYNISWLRVCAVCIECIDQTTFTSNLSRQWRFLEFASQWYLSWDWILAMLIWFDIISICVHISIYLRHCNCVPNIMSKHMYTHIYIYIYVSECVLLRQLLNVIERFMPTTKWWECIIIQFHWHWIHI